MYALNTPLRHPIYVGTCTPPRDKFSGAKDTYHDSNVSNGSTSKVGVSKEQISSPVVRKEVLVLSFLKSKYPTEILEVVLKKLKRQYRVFVCIRYVFNIRINISLF